MKSDGVQAGLLTRLLAASELRAKVISSNIANQNTPGYKRRVVTFEDRLRSALDSVSSDPSDIKPDVLVDEESPGRADGNNVSLELELNDMRENRLLYETYAAMLSAHFRMLEAAVTEGP